MISFSVLSFNSLNSVFTIWLYLFRSIEIALMVLNLYHFQIFDIQGIETLFSIRLICVIVISLLPTMVLVSKNILGLT